MNYRLIKTEPYKYSRDMFLQDGSTDRDGVRNYQARNNLKSMSEGDLCFWYHSNEGKEIVGIAEVTKEFFSDPTIDDERRVAVTLQPVEKLKKPVTLAQIKSDHNLSDISLLKQQRLSVAPISEDEYEYILNLGRK